MSNVGKRPLIFYGAVDDMTAWSGSGSPVVVTTQADPLGGTTAYSIEDDNGAGLEYAWPVAFTSVPGTNLLQAVLKAGTAAVTVLQFWDVASKMDITVTWSGGVPTLTLTAGAGVIFAPVAIGGGYYLIMGAPSGVAGGDTTSGYLYPAGTTASATGTVFVYPRRFVTAPFDGGHAFPMPRAGSEFVQAASGAEDSWVTGYDEIVAGSFRWIPSRPFSAVEDMVAGYDGAGDNVLCNASWRDFLRWAWESNAFTFIPDWTDASTYHDVKLIEPTKNGRMAYDSDGFHHRLEVAMRTTDQSAVTGY